MVDAEHNKLDPTTITKSTKFTIQYRIQLGDKTYQTTRSLFDFRADALCGRATRVWEVFLIPDDSTSLVPDPNTRLALKDMWLDGESEGALWQKLETAVKKNPQDKEIFDSYFLTHVHGAEVPVNGGILDKLKITHLLTVLLPTLPSQRSSKTHEGSLRASAVGQAAIVPEKTVESFGKRLSKFPLTRRKHYRDVFKQVCKVYHDLTDIHQMFTALFHIVKGMPMFMPSI